MRTPSAESRWATRILESAIRRYGKSPERLRLITALMLANREDLMGQHRIGTTLISPRSMIRHESYAPRLWRPDKPRD